MSVNEMGIIGQNIKKLRDERAVTQEQLAEKLCISYQAVSKWETGGAVPDTMLLPRIAEFFGVTIDELFKNKAVAYRSKAHRLASLYESEPASESFSAAEAELLKVIEKPVSVDPYLQAEDLRALGHLYETHMHDCRDRALDYYDRAIETAWCQREHLYACFEQQKISFLAQIGRGQESVERYLALIQEEPENCENHICAICAAFQTGQYELADGLFRKCLPKWGDNLMLLKLGGDVCRALKRYGQAFEYWNKSLELNEKRTEDTGENGFMDALFSIADCYGELGEGAKAYQAWKEIADRLGKLGFTVERAYALEMMQKYAHRK